jgi:hypothetical protein
MAISLIGDAAISQRSGRETTNQVNSPFRPTASGTRLFADSYSKRQARRSVLHWRIMGLFRLARTVRRAGDHCMSRALNLNAPQEHVLATCAKHKAPITQIETLVSGGTRVVLKNADDAAVIGRAYRNSIIDGTVTRTPSRTLHY